jgi:hypothetical protein
MTRPNFSERSGNFPNPNPIERLERSRRHRNPKIFAPRNAAEQKHQNELQRIHAKEVLAKMRARALEAKKAEQELKKGQRMSQNQLQDVLGRFNPQEIPTKGTT